MRGRILAIDPSTKMGLVVFDVLGTTVDCILEEEYSSKQKGMARLGDIGQKINDLLVEHEPVKVIIEGYSFMSKHNLVTMAEIGTVIRYFLWQADYEYRELPPPSLKKFVSGKGNCKKDLMLLNVYKKWGFSTENDNIADAFGLAMYELYACNDLIKEDGTCLNSSAKSFALNIK